MDKVMHGAGVDTGPKGSEGAFFTASALESMGGPEPLIADRPFLAVIRRSDSALPVFSHGRIRSKEG